MTIYHANGRRKRVAFRCPQCRSELTRVVMTRERENLVIRRRCCDDCKHRFFTAQEPEYLIRRELIKWSDSPFELRINERPDH